MSLVENVSQNVKNFYNKIENFTKTKPIAAIVSTIALSIFSFFISQYSVIAAIGVFGFTIFFDVAIYQNFQTIIDTIEEKVMQIFIDRKYAARARGETEGRRAREQAEDKLERFTQEVEGFFAGFFS